MELNGMCINSFWQLANGYVKTNYIRCTINCPYNYRGVYEMADY